MGTFNSCLNLCSKICRRGVSEGITHRSILFSRWLIGMSKRECLGWLICGNFLMTTNSNLRDCKSSGEESTRCLSSPEFNSLGKLHNWRVVFAAVPELIYAKLISNRITEVFSVPSIKDDDSQLWGNSPWDESDEAIGLGFCRELWRSPANFIVSGYWPLSWKI